MLADEEQARRRVRKKTIWAACVCAACLLAVFAAGCVRGFGATYVLALAAIVIASIVVVIIFATKPIAEFFTAYEEAYKAEINNVMVKHFSPALSYIEADGISRKTFDSCGLFTPSDRYGTSDLASGVYGKTQLRLARVYAEQVYYPGASRSGGGTRRTPIFEGVILVASVNKTFCGYTHIFLNDIEIPQYTAPRYPDRLVHLGNPEFEKEFSVYTDAPDEARSILTAPLMERMLELNCRCDRYIRFCFKDSSVIVALNSNDNDANLFDPDFDSPATDTAQLEKIYAQWAFFLGIVDALGLNEDAKTKL